MSRSCHRATSWRPACRFAADDPGQPADRLGGDRVALVGHRRRALLPRLEAFAAPRRPRCAGGGAARRRSTRTSTPSTRTPTATRRDGRGRSPESPAPDGGRARRRRGARPPDRCWSRCRPRPTACTPPRSRSPCAAGAIAIELQRPQRDLGAERGRLGVDAVGAADHHRVAVLAGEGDDGGDQRVDRRRRAAGRHRASPSTAPCRRRRTTSARSGSTTRPAGRWPPARRRRTRRRRGR